MHLDKIRKVFQYKMVWKSVHPSPSYDTAENLSFVTVSGFTVIME